MFRISNSFCWKALKTKRFFLENKIKELKKQTLKDMDGHYFKMDMTVTKKKKLCYIKCKPKTNL